MIDQVYVARVDGSDITHLAAYVDHVGGRLRAVCLPGELAQPFALVRAEEGERLAWCGACAAYREYLKVGSIVAATDADVITLDPSKRPRRRVKLPAPKTA